MINCPTCNLPPTVHANKMDFIQQGKTAKKAGLKDYWFLHVANRCLFGHEWKTYYLDGKEFIYEDPQAFRDHVTSDAVAQIPGAKP